MRKLTITILLILIFSFVMLCLTGCIPDDNLPKPTNPIEPVDAHEDLVSFQDAEFQTLLHILHQHDNIQDLDVFPRQPGLKSPKNN